MKKLRILLLALLPTLVSNLSAQQNFPTQSECEKFIQSNQKLHAEVEAKLGEKWQNLTVVSDEWKGYNGTIFSLSLTDCGKSIRGRGDAWPDDAAFAKWIVTTPKNKDGIYRTLGIYMDFKRTTFDGELCRLGDWQPNGYRLEGGEEEGHKSFSQKEMEDLFFNAAKSGELEALNYFIEIDELKKESSFYQNVPQPGQRYISVHFSGTLGKYSSDHSVTYCLIDGHFKLVLSLQNTDGKWSIANSKIDNYNLNNFQLDIGQYCNVNEAIINYESYESAGWEAIYKKRTERSMEGDYSQLMKRLEELNQVLLTEGVNLSQESLLQFVRPSERSNFTPRSVKLGDQYYLPFETKSDEVSLALNNAKSESVVFWPHEQDGKMVKYAFPELKMIFDKMKKKGKSKWLPIGGNNAIFVSGSKPEYGHTQLWVLEEGTWYLFDVASAFCTSMAADEFVRSWNINE